MWDAIWQSTVLAAIIFLLIKFLKKAPSSLKYWLWMLVPLKLFVMPFVTFYLPVLPSQEIPSIPLVNETPTMQSHAYAIPQANLAALEHAEMADAPVIIENLTGHTSLPLVVPSFWTCVFLLWVCGGVFVTCRMGNGWWKARKIVMKSVEVKDGPILETGAKAAKLLGLQKNFRIRISNACRSPFVMGTWTPVVVLPAALVDSVQRGHLLAVLAHEAAHLRRKDLLTGWVLALCEITYFFHPVVHFVKRRMILERERSCDDWVLTLSNAKPSHYARAIIAAAGACKPASMPGYQVTVVAESFSNLKHRLSAIASDFRPNAHLSKMAVVTLAILAVISVPAIVFTPRPAVFNNTETAPEIEVPHAQESGVGVIVAPAVQLNPTPLPQLETPTTQKTSEPPKSDQGVKVLRFPPNSKLGTLSVLKRRGTDRYRLARGSDWHEMWEPLAEARGNVTVPTGVPIKLRIFTMGLSDLGQLANLQPDDLHSISFEITPSPNNEPIVTGEQVLPYVQNLTGLKGLEMFGVGIHGPGLRYLKDFTKLEILEFGSTRFEDRNLGYLQNLDSLIALNLYVPVGDEGLKYLAALPSLRELALKYQRIGGYGLTYLGNIRSLEFLEIRGDGYGNTTGGPTNSVLRHLESIPSLRSLTLYSPMKITDTAAIHLKKLTNLEDLRFIKQGGVIKITDKAMPYIGQMTNLRRLDLAPTMVTDNGMAELAGLTNLEYLELPASKATGRARHAITDASLAHAAKFRRLKSLFAGRGEFTDEGLSHISGLIRLESLVINSAAQSGATDVGISYLPQLQRLQTLNLTWGGLTNRGAAYLGNMKSLRTLELTPRGSRFTVAGVNKFNGLSRLQRMRLNNVKRDDTVLDIGALTNLEHLSMEVEDPKLRRSNGAVRDTDLISIGKLKNLTYLGFYDSALLTDEGLAHLAGMTRLERLFIGGPNITDQGLAHLARMTSLYQLNITGNFTDRGLRQLDPLIGLRYLSIKSPGGVSAKMQQHIRGNLPNLYSFQVSGGGIRF
jgi:beta-lactamase regulating signal transducer with metallopeptidase domain